MTSRKAFLQMIPSARKHKQAALDAFAEDCGDRRMNLEQAEAITRQLLEKNGL